MSAVSGSIIGAKGATCLWAPKNGFNGDRCWNWRAASRGNVKLPFNLFDILLVAVLITGVVHGRKQGLSRELIRLVKWGVLVFACAMIYQPAGMIIAKSGFCSILTSYLFAYLGSALLIFLLFSMLERRWTPKLTGSDIFGRSEYFLGMGSGMVRFACVLLMSLSLLNAREFTPAELKAIDQYEEEAYGAHVFPGLHSLQTEVFENSLTGSWIKQDLSFLLITPTAASQGTTR
jgi:hypothetical protein